MKRIQHYMIGILIFFSTPSSQAQRYLELSDYRLVWSEEFEYRDSNSLFFPTEENEGQPKWYCGTWWNCPVCFGPWGLGYSEISNARLQNGILKMFSRPLEGDSVRVCNESLFHSCLQISTRYNQDYPGVEIKSASPNPGNIGFHYGIFEIRCKLPKGKTAQAAFWFFEGAWQDGHEIQGASNCAKGFSWELDPFEFANINDEGDYIFSTNIQPNPLNQHPGPCLHCATSYRFEQDPREDFHTYTLAWTPERFTVFVDGIEIRTHESGIPPLKMNMILTATGAGQSDPFEIDYIRVYRPREAPDIPENGSIWKNVKDPGRKHYAQKEAWPDYFKLNNWVDHTLDFSTQKVRQLVILPDNKDTLQLCFQKGKRWYSILLKGMDVLGEPVSWSNHSATKTDVATDVETGKLFYQGTDGDLWLYYHAAGGWKNGKLDYQDRYLNNVAGSLVYSFPKSLVHAPRVYYKDASGQLWYFEWNGREQYWNQHPTNVRGIQGSLCAAPDSGKLYYRGQDDHLWTVLPFGRPETWLNQPLDTPYLAQQADVRSDMILNKAENKIYYINPKGEIAFRAYYETPIPHWEAGLTNIAGATKLVSVFPAWSSEQISYFSSENRLYSGFPSRQNEHVLVSYPMQIFISRESKGINPGFATPQPDQNGFYYLDLDQAGSENLHYLEWSKAEGIIQPACIDPSETYDRVMTK